MPFAPATAVAIFITIWWIPLFAILPLGVRSPHDGEDEAFSGDPGAPIAPRLLTKAALTTLVSVALFAALVLYLRATA